MAGILAGRPPRSGFTVAFENFAERKIERLRWTTIQELVDDRRNCYLRAFLLTDGSWEVWTRTIGLFGVYTDLELAREDFLSGKKRPTKSPC